MANISVFSQREKFAVCDSLYGLFFEDINRAGDGGLYPELLRNRAFEDSLYPDDLVEKEGDLANAGGWVFEYQHGEGLKRWKENLEPTPIPAWYGENAKMRLERGDTLNKARLAALDIDFGRGGRVYNVGFCGVPVRKGAVLRLYFYAKHEKLAKAESGMKIVVSVEKNGRPLASGEICVQGSEYARYDIELVSTETAKDARLCIEAPAGGSLRLGFISLMPADSYRRHGLRKDLCEKLEALKPGFLRFPGGCIVEGFSESTILRFKNMVGPVWERPSVLDLWSYRSTQGLGFHEYLQLCEDLNTDAMYVCNCGMTCQVREPVLLDDGGVRECLEDALCAIEYALGDEQTKWGALRARMGHPEPFALKYLEIGNENFGSDYEERYQVFHKEITEKYPGLVIVANTHVENSGLPLDIADEHFYNKTEWFAMNTHQYDGYDRKGPGIFVGEFAVVAGNIRTLYAAVGEAMFMIGLERNQDVVKLAAYAPLFENVKYAAWEPNLIAFDGLDHYAIPSYYVWKLFADNRGRVLLESGQDCDAVYAPYLRGGPCLCGSEGVHFKNAYWRGEPLENGKEIFGQVIKCGDGSCTTKIMPGSPQEETAKRFGMDDRVLIVLSEDLTSREGCFEIELLAEPDKELSVGMFAIPYGKARNSEDSPWNLFSVQPVRWKIAGGESRLMAGVGFREEELSEPVKLEPEPYVYHKLEMETDGKMIWCRMDGTEVAGAELPHYDEIQSVVTQEEDTIIIKAANIAEEARNIEINTDCDICDVYTADVICGMPTDCNTLEEPEKVTGKRYEHSGAGRHFIYQAPAMSVNVLRLKKKGV